MVVRCVMLVVGCVLFVDRVLFVGCLSCVAYCPLLVVRCLLLVYVCVYVVVTWWLLCMLVVFACYCFVCVSLFKYVCCMRFAML